MSIAEAERASGLVFRGAVEQGGQSCYNVEYRTPSGGIWLLVKNGRIAVVSVSGAEYATMSGVRTGDPEAKVRAAYRSGLTEFRTADPDGSDVFVFVPKDPSEAQYRMVFGLMAGPPGGASSVVSGIHAAKLPDGKYLLGDSAGDGCSDHIGTAMQLAPTKSTELRDASMLGELFALGANLKYGVSTLYDPKKPNDPSVRGRLRAWDLNTGALTAEWTAHGATIQSLAIAPSGDVLASSASDRSVALWRLPAGQQVARWVDATESIQSLSFDSTGSILVGSGAKVVRVWNASTGALRSSMDGGTGSTVVSPDGSLVASPSAVFDVRSGRAIRSIEVDGNPNCMGFSPDGRYFALCQWDRIDFWDVGTWRIVWKFQRTSRHVPFNALAFHPSGQLLAATLGDSIWLLDLITGEPVAIARGSQNATAFSALGFTPSGIALVAVNGSQLNRWLVGSEIALAPGAGFVNGRTPEAKIMATALGQSATNGGRLNLKVPTNVGIEVTFTATEASQAVHTFSWSVDGKPVGDGTRIVRWLRPGQHSVEVQAWEAGNYGNSTPTTIAAAKTPSQIGRISVDVNEEPSWSCLGRLGAGCNDGPKNTTITTAVTVSVACRGKPNQVCIASSISVGAIRHDRCCEDRKVQGRPPGHWCDNNSDQEDPSACAAEWAQAELDSKLAALFELRPSAAIPRFGHTWVYPPDGSDAPSLGNKGWWRALAGPGVIMSYFDAQPDKLEQSVCRSGSASRQTIGGMGNFDLAVGPIFSKTHGWICD